MEFDHHPAGEEPGSYVPAAMRHAAELMGSVGAILVLLLALLINTDILSRFLANYPIKGTAELVELAIVIIVFIQLPLTVATGGLVRSSELHKTITEKSPAIGKALMLFFEFGGVVLFGLLTWALWPELVEAWQDNLYKGQPGLFTAPIWPAVLITLIGSAFAAVCYFISFLTRLRRKSV